MCVSVWIFSVLLHVGLILGAPEIGGVEWVSAVEPQEMEVELVIEEEEEEKVQFVSANRELLSEESPDAELISSISQVAAQPEVSDEDIALPDIKNESERVGGELFLGAHASREALASELTQQLEEQQQRLNEERLAQRERPEDSAIELKTPIEEVLEEVVKRERVVKPKPKPRPRVKLQALSDLANYAGGAKRVGVHAVNARFNHYGEYVQRMNEAIYYQWHQFLLDRHYHGQYGKTVVNIRVSLNSRGEVMAAESMNPDVNRMAQLVARDAVLSRSPYGEWSSNIINTVGESTELVITFQY